MMAEAKRPSQVKLIIGVIFTSEGILIEAKVRLEKKFGPVDFQSSLMPFNRTKYYEKAMGPDLKRQFLSFQRLINPRQLSAIKLYTNRLEKGLSQEKSTRGRNSKIFLDPEADRPKDLCLLYQDKAKPSRTINLDPGYISASKLVLATCKNYSHRIYLDKGIFAEVTLHFRSGTFTPWPWTYPDYKSKDYIQGFNMIREIYLKQHRH